MTSMNRVCGRVALAWAFATAIPAAAAWAQAAPQQITLAEALERAGQASPLVGIAGAQLDAARARRDQVGAGINPEASYTLENFGGSGGFGGTGNAEATIGLSQQVELGGKREARRDTAGRQADVVGIRAAQVRAELNLAVRERFAELSAAEERLDLARDALTRATKLAGVAQALVDAGREPPLRLLRAQASAAGAKADVSVAEAEHAAARRALAAFWNGDEMIDAVGAWEFQLADEALNTAPTATLDYRLAVAEHDAAEAALRLEKANAWVDVTVSAGYRRFEATGDTAWIAGVSVPIPVQDRNGGAIAAARADDRAAELQLNVVLTDTVRKLNDARSAFAAADARATVLETQAVRQAEEALGLAQIGYEAGRFQLIDVLDAEDAFGGIRNAAIDARLARARAAAALLRANAQ